MENRNKATLLGGIDAIFVQHSNCGFHINALLMYQDFNALEEDIIIQKTIFNPESSKEHVRNIEWMIRLYKEKIRERYSRFKFRKIPRVMVCEILEDAIIWMDNIPPKAVISENLIPQMIITGTPLDYEKLCKFEFESYAQFI